jgi:hypothetical protein
MDDQQNDADSNEGFARQQQPWMGSAGQHEEQADYCGPASDRCQGIAHGYIIARGVSRLTITMIGDFDARFNSVGVGPGCNLSV